METIILINKPKIDTQVMKKTFLFCYFKPFVFILAPSTAASGDEIAEKEHESLHQSLASHVVL